MNRIILKGIGKFTHPDEELVPRDPYKEKDYYFTMAIAFSEVIMYESYVPNPEHRCYQYDGPLTKICIKGDYERMAMIPFEVFDKAYCEYYEQQFVTIKPN